MKKVALLFVAVVLAFLLTSCGGSSQVSSDSTDTASADSSGAPPPVEEPVLSVPRIFEVKPNTPQFFKDALKTRAPIMVLFYSDDTISRDVLTEVNKIYADETYGGVVTFLLMKMGDSDRVTELAKEFAVGYIPHAAVLNRDGEVIFERKGYVDGELLEQAVYDASNK